MAEERKIRVHNKSDKPDNVVARENEIFEECEKIERELPGWMRGYFMYLRNGVLPMSRLSYLRELRFFLHYLLKETELQETCTEMKKIQPGDLNKITSMDVNLFIDYCRRYKVEDEKGNVTVYENGNAALAHKKSAVSVFFKYLYRDGLVEKNITDGFDPIRLPKPGERVIKALQALLFPSCFQRENPRMSDEALLECTARDLTEQIDLLGLNAIVGSLGTLHSRGTIADAVLVHELHLLPGILGELFHIGDNLHLTVEHQQRIVEVGDARDDVGLHHRLVVLRGDELHLSRALRTEQVAEEIDIPAGTDGQLVGLGGLGPVEGGQRALRTEHQ